MNRISNEMLRDLPGNTLRFPEALQPLDLRSIQINLGSWCNQSCSHCHVGASPLRTETISAEVVDRCLEIIASTPSIEVVDLTGGAPEGHREFRRLAAASRGLGRRVIDRCNLTILTEPGFEDLADWLADNDIEIVASYPHCEADVTDAQRGSGVYQRSLTGLRLLNKLGYGIRRSLHLVYNPTDCSLSGDQQAIENDYRRKLTPQGIEFSGLYALNNMPLGRFLESLIREGKYQEYMTKLGEGFNQATLPGLMCRHQLSVSWDGRVYDCDFNQAAGFEQLSCLTVFDFDPDRWLHRVINTGSHCFGCTAATGSSCTGSLVSNPRRGSKVLPGESFPHSVDGGRADTLPASAGNITMDLAAIRRYYGEILKKSGDLKTDACCTLADMPLWLRRALGNVHTEVLDRYFGCGLVAPEAVEGCTIVDLGCGSGRDVYVLAQLVGENGRVIGVDMTPEQVAVARRHQQWHAHRHGYHQPNTEVIEGFIEDLSALADHSVDIVISNCVLNLSPDKSRVLREVFRVLKPGGEMYFSDVYADRRLSFDIRRNEVLWGECLAGALYWMDFLSLAKKAGFLDPRLVTDRVLAINNPELAELLAPAKFWSATWRLFKLDMLEPICEDFGQVVRYRGGITEFDAGFHLDNHHSFEKGQSVKVCSNTWHMLKDTRFSEYFDFWGDEKIHFGAFADCGSLVPFKSRHNGSADEGDGGAACC